MRDAIFLSFCAFLAVASAGEVCDGMFTLHKDAGLEGDPTSGAEVSFAPTSTETYDSPEACCTACLDDPECLYILAVDGPTSVSCYLKKTVSSTYVAGSGTQACEGDCPPVPSQAYFTRNSPPWGRNFTKQAAYVVTFPDRGPDYPKGIITLVQRATPFTQSDLAITTNLTGLGSDGLGCKWHGAWRALCLCTPVPLQVAAVAGEWKAAEQQKKKEAEQADT